MNTTIRFGRWLAAATAGCCAILLPGMAQAAPGAPAAAVRPAAHLTAPGCETPGLVIWLDTNGNGAAGSVFYNLEFTNLSGHACTLNGFPFVNAVSLTGSLLGLRARFDRTITPHSVTLGRGATAKAVLQIVDVSILPKSKCNPVTAAGLRIFPPNQTTAKVVPFPFGACSASGARYMSVRPVTK
jgi:hypothetical protein